MVYTRDMRFDPPPDSPADPPDRSVGPHPSGPVDPRSDPLDDVRLDEASLDDLELEAASFGEEPPRRRGGLIALAIVVLLAAAVVLFFLLRRPPPPPPVAEAIAEVELPPAEEPVIVDDETEPIDLPPLDGSDELVRRLVADISSRPELARWLATDDLARRFVAAVDNVAEGASPRPHLAAIEPDEPFTAGEAGGRAWMDEDSYRRYDTLTAVVGSLDVEGTAQLYRALRPLFDDAYRELGYPEGRFEESARRAVATVLGVPRIEGPIELERKVMSYRYADPRLEALSDAEKQLLRLGPRNLTIVQEKVRAVAEEIGLY